jgi:hypothetical protein
MIGRRETLFAVAAETVTAGRFPVRLERFGRAYMKGQLLGELGGDTLNRDSILVSFGTRRTPSVSLGAGLVGLVDQCRQTRCTRSHHHGGHG